MTINKITEEQKILCGKYRVEYFLSDLNQIIGIADNILTGNMPVNGLRHLPADNISGWYVWSGKDLPIVDDNFFKPTHLKHLIEKYPWIIKYFGLPQWYRFLTDGKYEDVWKDQSLLEDK